MFLEKIFREKFIKIGIVLGLAAVFFTLAWRPSHALQQDLGRHIKLGAIILENGAVPETNLFSYTFPDFRFVNHHWLSEVVFFLFDFLFGLTAIFWFKVISLALANFLIFYLAARFFDFLPTVLSFLAFTPFLMNRIDERPELFGYVFFALFMLLFFTDLRQRKWLVVLLAPFVMGLWINLHITFVYGGFLTAVFSACTFAKKDFISWPKKYVGFMWAMMCGALLLNPNGLEGFFYPLRVFDNYGYSIVENQNLLFLFPRIPHNLIIYFFIVFFIFTFLGFLLFLRERKVNIFMAVYLAFSVLAFFAIRNFPFFGLAGVPFGAYVLGTMGSFLRKAGSFFSNGLNRYLLALAITLIYLLNVVITYGQGRHGILRLYEKGVDFVIQNELPGRIFNDFDVGGYLDYRLYPKYQVFVDNRPEAYPESFFQDYIKIQEDPVFREKKFAEYGINTIIFNRNDYTSWAQKFLTQISRDKNWEMRYLDDYLVVFSKISKKGF